MTHPQPNDPTTVTLPRIYVEWLEGVLRADATNAAALVPVFADETQVVLEMADIFKAALL